MKHIFIKVVIGAIALFLSPMIIVALLGSIFILFQIIGGSTFHIAYQSLITIIENLKPYLPYLTFVPMLLVIFTVMMKIFIKKKKSSD
jgi:Ca2+/Na+ antiporter